MSLSCLLFSHVNSQTHLNNFYCFWNVLHLSHDPKEVWKFFYFLTLCFYSDHDEKLQCCAILITTPWSCVWNRSVHAVVSQHRLWMKMVLTVRLEVHVNDVWLLEDTQLLLHRLFIYLSFSIYIYTKLFIYFYSIDFPFYSQF